MLDVQVPAPLVQPIGSTRIEEVEIVIIPPFSCFRFLGCYLTFLAKPYRDRPTKAGKSTVSAYPKGRG